jgi:hypothetical protein
MMASNFRRQQLLESLGVEQLPSMTVMQEPSTPAQGMEALISTASVCSLLIVLEISVWILIEDSASLMCINVMLNSLTRS